MTPMKHVLCPIDVSATSEFALTYAALLAKRLGSKLTVLHVYQTWSDVYPDDNATLREQLDGAVRERVGGELREMVTRCCAELQPELVLREGVPYTEIVDQAVRLGADLVVMGTHGRTGAAHLLLGSVAERVMRLSPVPVMTVRKPGGA